MELPPKVGTVTESIRNPCGMSTDKKNGIWLGMSPKVHTPKISEFVHGRSVESGGIHGIHGIPQEKVGDCKVLSPRIVRIFLSYKVAVHQKESVDKGESSDESEEVSKFVCEVLYGY